MTRVVSFVVLIGIVLLVSVLAFRVMASFLLPMFLAIVMVIVARPMHEWIIEKCNRRERLAAVITTFLLTTIVLAPLLGTTILAAADLYTYLSRPALPGGVMNGVRGFRESAGLELPVEMVAFETSLDRLTRITRGLAPPGNWQNEVDGLTGNLAAIEADIQRLPAGVDPGTLSLPPDLKGLSAQLKSLEGLGQNNQLLDDERAKERLQQSQQIYKLLRPKLIECLRQRDDDPENNIGALKAWLAAQANPSDEQLEELRSLALEQLGMGSLVSAGQYVGGALGKLILGLFVMVIALYYFLADGPAMVEAIMSISPLQKHYAQQMLSEFAQISRAVVLAILVAAVVQGALATIGYALAGLQSLVLLGVLTTLLAMIPFVGAASVWIPCSLWVAFVDQRQLAGALLALWGLLFVSMIDNFIKPWVLHGQSKLHPLLALLSIIGGVQALGPIGIFVGPMVVSFLQAVLNMFHLELKALAEENAGPAAATEKPDEPNPPGPGRRRRGKR